MKLKVGDIIEFKKYEDMNSDERMMLDKDSFPLFGTVKKVFNNFNFFYIEEKPYYFNAESVARVINDNDALDVIKNSDEALVRTIVKEVFNEFLQAKSSIDKKEAMRILGHQIPEHFIVQESHYNMYIGATLELVSDKDKAKIYTSRNTAEDDAIDMHLNKWKVIPYEK